MKACLVKTQRWTRLTGDCIWGLKVKGQGHWKRCKIVFFRAQRCIDLPLRQTKTKMIIECSRFYYSKSWKRPIVECISAAAKCFVFVTFCHRMSQRSTYTSDTWPIYQWLYDVFGAVFRSLTVAAIRGPRFKLLFRTLALQNINRTFLNDISRTKSESDSIARTDKELSLFCFKRECSRFYYSKSWKRPLAFTYTVTK